MITLLQFVIQRLAEEKGLLYAGNPTFNSRQIASNLSVGFKRKEDAFREALTNPESTELKKLAVLWDTHPDYREEWRP